MPFKRAVFYYLHRDSVKFNNWRLLYFQSNKQE